MHHVKYRSQTQTLRLLDWKLCAPTYFKFWSSFTAPRANSGFNNNAVGSFSMLWKIKGAVVAT